MCTYTVPGGLEGDVVIEVLQVPVPGRVVGHDANIRVIVESQLALDTAMQAALKYVKIEGSIRG